MRVAAYLRVSTAEQRNSGLGLAAQRAAIESETERRGWEVVEWIEDAGYSAKSLRRPGIARALELLEAGEAEALVAAKLDRLSRSVLDFTSIMALAERQGWAVVALDAVDTTTPAGEAMAHMLATFAQFERRLIGQRTKAALAEARARGVRLGRPPVLAAELVARIRTERRAGATLQEVADRLTAEGIPTAHGGRWWPSTVRKLTTMEEAA
jgi:DNA invertase Pin-like site-specific DNA recombinase